MRNRRRNWLLRRLVLGFAIALVVVPAAQAYPDEGAKVQGTFVQGVDDFPGSSKLTPQLDGPAAPAIVLAPKPDSVVLAGDDKRDIGARPTAGVLVGDDKRGIRTPTSGIVLIGDDKRNVALGRDFEPTVAAEYNQYAYRRALPQDLGPQAAVLAELDAKTQEYVAGAAPVVDEPVQVVSNTSNGFDWGDAGIGAGTVFAVLLLGAGAALATRHVGHPAQV
jgi:hypothetical protein